MPAEHGQRPPVNINDLGGQEKIEHIRGKVSNYSSRIRETLISCLPHMQSADSEDVERIAKAFEGRIESYLANPSGGFNGGDKLAHLPQIGVRLVDENQYQQLARSAAALAGTFMKEAGYEDRANSTFADLGRMVAPDYNK